MVKRRRGFIQIAILHLLKEEPMHGYRIMKELEDRAGGFYSASAGTIYPALQELLELEMITLESTSDKKTYYIIENGLARLEEVTNRKGGNFWGEWKARFVWQSSEEALHLKNTLEVWDAVLKKAIKQVRQHPETSTNLIAFIEEITEVLKRDNK